MNLFKAVVGCARSAFTNQGEVCLCTERTYVHESIYDEFLAKLKLETAKWTIGDPRDPKTKIGPLVSQVHYEKVIGCFEKAKSKGFKFKAFPTQIQTKVRSKVDDPKSQSERSLKRTAKRK